ncbi:hypothetical protein AYI70_g12341 [Smittium culicis]|uniref:HAUS augmin-like complex subunit 6 N-terminal domain-containing protein n=1 Tax=Smittium culicis TaxID=133412 RepID=A0A1R1WXU2_9FUNG|nr:hypothetical protein AYI70_g12341 [Smittium culicis]
MDNEVMRLQFWQLLLALGFDPYSTNFKIYSGINYDPHIFSKGIDHSRAAELVLYFLLTLIDPRRSKLVFNSCFPVCEPRQSREFRSVCFKWMDELKSDSSENRIWPRWSQVRRSYFDECLGIRFESMVWGLAIAASFKKIIIANKLSASTNKNKYINTINTISFIMNYNPNSTVDPRSTESKLLIGLLEESKSNYTIANNDRILAANLIKTKIDEYNSQISEISTTRSELLPKLRNELVFLSKKGITFFPLNSPSLESLNDELETWKTEIYNLLFKPAEWIQKQSYNIETINNIINPSHGKHFKLLTVSSNSNTNSTTKPSNNYNLVLDGNAISSLFNFENSSSYSLATNNNCSDTDIPSSTNTEFLEKSRHIIENLYRLNQSSNKLELDLSQFFKLSTFALNFVSEKISHQQTFNGFSLNALDSPNYSTSSTTPNTQQRHSALSNPSIGSIDDSIHKASLAIDQASSRIDKLSALKYKLKSFLSSN